VFDGIEGSDEKKKKKAFRKGLGFRVWRMDEQKGVKAMTHSMTATIRT
jgi:hypothetical protein